MKQFFKFFFASLLGTVAAFIILGFFSFLLLLSISSMINTDEIVTITPNTILELSFNKPLPERSYYDPMGFSNLLSTNVGKRIGINDVIKSIKKAEDDQNISGIYLKLDDMNAGSYTVVEPVRNALEGFKKSGKFIIAHGNNISQKSYYLGSIADSIFLTPSGNLEFKGLSAELTFFKKTLEKLDIEAQIIRAGKFKSAVEPFISEKMSDENRLQINGFINSIYNYLLNKISKSRNISTEELSDLADNLKIQFPTDAKRYGLVDDIKYEVEVKELLKKFAGMTLSQSLRTIGLKRYLKVEGAEIPYSSNRIAVIYAIGEITAAKGDELTIGKENVVNAVRKAKDNDYIKAIVLRVNSPGGSSLISDLIWKEIELAKAEKPIIVSFSSYAASGGYYISCGADKIVSEPTTLTGSIGAYSIIPNTQEFFDNKLGITFDKVTTGRYSDFISGIRPLSKYEKQILEKQVDTVYNRFINDVSDGRRMSSIEVNEIAQGRIWSGLQAKEIGLVDEIGGLDKAIQIAAEISNIENYRIVEYPAIRDAFEVFFESFFDESSINSMSAELKNIYMHYSSATELIQNKEIKTRLPFDLQIN